ncbi:metal ABC transporter substrate-binding protein [Nitrososphaera viennensis]|uniref:Zinc ABC transporter substrate-binding protein n=2 Tax=Nitrososphaera viennensis TaxID=1034015 RepID=A0A977NL30_9ARCH|nr:zinc ABC transporter substrate-binding protein [Nitrososphaera viennensis]AIC16362.1 putative Zinc uptake transporter, substrate-binding protein [Nitrososphaera viennensis EN76]UVS68298.1 zinc ABC transporter substrate-binding protein [Nitrososphaera viennensis]
MASSKVLMIGMGAGAAVAIAIAVAAFATMGGSATTTPAAAPDNNNAEGAQKVKVIASFFPLYDFTRQVGGDRADVSVMVPPGVEPHDWEPTPQQIQRASSANMLVYNGAGFEKWVDAVGANFTVNTSEGMSLLNNEDPEEQKEHGLYDPHIWLDPVLAKHQVDKIREGLVKIDPPNADYYNANAAKFASELDALDSHIKSELSSCEKKDFIAFHEAFSYFSNRYNLTQHAVHDSLTPEGEILPQRLEELVKLAKDLDIHVVYSEELVDPRLAQVIASEIPNGRVLTLSPIEGLDEQEQAAGLGYLDKMREDVANLKVGLVCS